MTENYDEGLKEDFDNMTADFGVQVLVFKREDVINYEGQETEDSERIKHSVAETVSMQELDSTHEMVAAGQLDVGDVKFTFQADSIAKEEGYVQKNDKWYKILEISYIRGISNDKIIYIKAFGKKVPMR